MSLPIIPGLPGTPAEWGSALGAFGLSLVGYLLRAKPKPSTEDAKTLAAAVTAPLGEANQVRQVVEELHRLNDYAYQLVALADDVKEALRDLKDGQRELRDAINRRSPA